jgi:hypothetical protein
VAVRCCTSLRTRGTRRVPGLRIQTASVCRSILHRLELRLGKAIVIARAGARVPAAFEVLSQGGRRSEHQDRCSPSRCPVVRRSWRAVDVVGESQFTRTAGPAARRQHRTALATKDYALERIDVVARVRHRACCLRIPAHRHVFHHLEVPRHHAHPRAEATRWW